MFGREQLARTAPGLAVEKLDNALGSWPGSELSGAAGHILRDAALQPGRLEADSRERLSQAVEFYGQAKRLNPYDPEWPVNRANLLSALGRDDEAERDYETAVKLQGGMEGTFRARFYFARHLYLRWYRAWTTQERPPGEALAAFLKARELFKEAAGLTEAWVRGKEEADLVKGLEETITFLEGARIVPDPPPEK
jgi:tetratricopeptide (TPR) repeat protein